MPGQATGAQRGVHLLFLLCARRILIQGPPAPGTGHAQLFVPYREWVPGAARSPGAVDPGAVDPHDAGAVLPGPARLALDYFRSHGPATERDLAWWLGLPLGTVRAMIAEAAPLLACRRWDGTDYWMDPRTAQTLRADPNGPGARSVLALPGFDELLLGYRDRGAVRDPVHADRVVPGGNGVFKRVVVAGGRAVATWAPGAAEPFPGEWGTARARAFEARMREHRRILEG
ncbi:DNA glycosylase AlkZ-like family protein [Zafaria sp. Z1313]|uniref:DNA glycosylase AlkZ-like family protein n=1 Tax=Zafaria sp. Z1313 TaxID=3423202 RepID=UPI003D302277